MISTNAGTQLQGLLAEQIQSQISGNSQESAFEGAHKKAFTWNTGSRAAKKSESSMSASAIS
jgi:hypothetical protein